MIAWFVLVAALLFLVVGMIGLWRGVKVKVSFVHRVMLWTVALILGSASALFLTYPLDARTRVYGFPLPAASFERAEDGQWLDFVGPTTGPFVIGNAILTTGFVLFVLFAIVTYRRRTKDRVRTGQP